jgi:hypothetical protein
MASGALLVNPPNASLPLVNPTTGAPAPSSGGLAFLQGITNALNGTQGVAAAGVDQITLGIGIRMSAGAGSPNGVVVGNPGDLYVSMSGGAGTTFYVKESGTNTNTGWQGK